MNIKRATSVAIVGVAISMVAGISLHLLPVTHGAPYRLPQLISVVSFLSLHIGLLVFLIVLYRRQ
ncbi:MAG: hypothetical protein FJ224_08530 [Lentisphaerae bacterium]|nr:hypothetical protein [Lentisphaerota bacterium]